jgi:hypothetical protein
MLIVNQLQYKKHRREAAEWAKGQEEFQKIFNRVMSEQKKEPRAEA